MNKRALLGILFLIVIVVLLILGLLFFYQLKTKGLEFSVGNLIIDIRYDDQKGEKEQVSVVEEAEHEDKEENETLQNSSLQELTFNSTEGQRTEYANTSFE